MDKWALGDSVIFHIEDDEGTHEVDCTVTKFEHGVPLVSPTHWLGEGHHILDRFKAELEGYLTGDPSGPEVEEWATDYILAVTSKLGVDMWATWKGVVAS